MSKSRTIETGFQKFTNRSLIFSLLRVKLFLKFGQSVKSDAIERVFGNALHDFEFGLIREPPLDISNNSASVNMDNAFGLIHGGAFSNGSPIMEMFLRIQAECMDITAMRLVWISKSGKAYYLKLKFSKTELSHF
jgi:hypothetical protein